jgi:hypothetical protein
VCLSLLNFGILKDIETVRCCLELQTTAENVREEVMAALMKPVEGYIPNSEEEKESFGQILRQALSRVISKSGSEKVVRGIIRRVERPQDIEEIVQWLL